jgi:hypothetical protein
MEIQETAPEAVIMIADAPGRRPRALRLATIEECDALIIAATNAKWMIEGAIAAVTPIDCEIVDDDDGDEDGPMDDEAELARADEIRALCESERVTRGNPLLQCSLNARHEGLHSALTPTGAFLAEWNDDPECGVHTPSGFVEAIDGPEPAAAVTP